MRTNKWLLPALLGLVATPAAVMAADHIDSPAAVADPSIDITDLYAWPNNMSTKINLVLNVSPFASDDAEFSDAAQYVFHVNSSAGYGMAQTETLIICEFDSSQNISCWAGDDEYVTGDASATAGIRSESQKLRVFAGPRNDPFFMEFAGFTNAVEAVVAGAGGLDFDAANCPNVDEDLSGTLVGLLQSGDEGADASDTFLGANVLSLVVQVDKDVVNSGGPVLGVWASTHMKP